MMEAPKRIQFKRIKGWRMPENTVYVGRPSRWGNSYQVAEYGREEAIALYRAYVLENREALQLEKLRGKNLACFCREGLPCHADVLLELANA